MANINILVLGSKSFSNYMEFVRVVSVTIDSLRSLEDDTGTIRIYSAGPKAINSFTAEYCNVVEQTMKAYGYKIRFSRIPWKVDTANFKKLDLHQVVTLGIAHPEAEPHVINAMLSGIETVKY